MPQFVKGKSGNPGGRRRNEAPRIDLIAEIKRQLAAVDPASRQSKAEGLIAALLEAGCGGEIAAIKEVLNRLHGRIAEASPEGGLPTLEEVAELMRVKYVALRGVPAQLAPPAADEAFLEERRIQEERQHREPIREAGVAVQPESEPVPAPGPKLTEDEIRMLGVMNEAARERERRWPTAKRQPE